MPPLLSNATVSLRLSLSSLPEPAAFFHYLRLSRRTYRVVIPGVCLYLFRIHLVASNTSRLARSVGALLARWVGFEKNVVGIAAEDPVLAIILDIFVCIDVMQFIAKLGSSSRKVSYGTYIGIFVRKKFEPLSVCRG